MVGCQTLLWILVAGFSWWYIINVIVLLVASFCFSYKGVAELIRGTRQVTNLETHEAQV
ncbi:hypothetical protein JHK87_017753 [Glycine soja]|nr:hypothetical protein JHK87_017753 [Glycine soja]